MNAVLAHCPAGLSNLDYLASHFTPNSVKLMFFFINSREMPDLSSRQLPGT
jgi:hypothetical protein